ncbi:MAG TPA: hypothetical protein VKU41_23245 [Polyangiaceae bacterium]|nr:hypothetical protein [Polyangiaceae bacterium]
MAKLIILSIVLVSVALPIWYSGRPNPRRTLRRVQWSMVLFIVVWAYLCLRRYPAMVPLK